MEMRLIIRFIWGSIDYGKLGHSFDILDPEINLRSNIARSDINISQIREPKLAEVFASKSIKASKIICRYNNTFLIDDKGKAYVLGATEKGSNGTGRKKQYIKEPEILEGFGSDRVLNIDCGNSFCLALSETGKVFSWGLNIYGQLGNSPNHCEFTPKQIYNFEKPIKQIACGEYFSAAVDFEGKVYTWGRGDSGQLGHRNTTDLDKPKVLDSDQIFVKVSTGDSHLMLLNNNGEVYVTGNGRDGQIGRGDKIESSAKFRMYPMKLDFKHEHTIIIDDIKAGGNHCMASGYFV